MIKKRRFRISPVIAGSNLVLVYEIEEEGRWTSKIQEPNSQTHTFLILISQPPEVFAIMEQFSWLFRLSSEQRFSSHSVVQWLLHFISSLLFSSPFLLLSQFSLSFTLMPIPLNNLGLPSTTISIIPGTYFCFFGLIWMHHQIHTSRHFRNQNKIRRIIFESKGRRPSPMH